MFSVITPFLKELLHIFKTNWLLSNNIKLFYILPVIAMILGGMGIIYPAINNLLSNIVLAMFFVFLIIILSILLLSYFKYKSPQLKILLISIMIPFLPFLFYMRSLTFYVINIYFLLKLVLFFIVNSV